MTLLALPGRRPETLATMQGLLDALGEPTAAIQAYGFWAGDHANPDVEPEARIAAASGAGRVVALSIGTLVAMTACRAHGFRPRACVFIGTPVKRLAAEGRLDLLAEQAAAIPTLFVQQTADPTGAFAELAAALPANAEVREVPGADHRYAHAAGLARLIQIWPAWRVP
jgi:hypothetical protein